ncbi:hypothetical protein Bca52824_049605 [Brassica carinata]|uniref:GDP-Man:Man(3)GlcNAc(2)-PP-Dol alpha-1,2-mannosyltransferase n=1 Tax=Brassica carinata TaxID=52824 RepID=A0A8X7UVF2_BRACI|nr:hypothetical protein Bca52824_049605 [Brassica carinata]
MKKTQSKMNKKKTLSSPFCSSSLIRFHGGDLLHPLRLLLLLSLTLSLSIINARKSRKQAVGFFHPYTNDGGGESPLVRRQSHPGRNSRSRLHRLHRRSRLFLRQLIPPRRDSSEQRKWIEEATYPRFTMIGQSLGSVYLWEALRKFTPLYFVDTSGYAFTYPLARLFGCKVVCYTHYPTISLDMISRVRSRNSMYNNDASIAKSNWLSTCKVVYYRAFSWLYGMVGSCTHLAMVNSSWTKSHIEVLWRIPERIRRVYPPCDTSGLQTLPLERSSDPPVFISVAQFRPEKAHMLQLEAFSLALEKLDPGVPRPKLQFVGSCRNESDEERLQKLKDRAVELKVNGDVEFYKNAMYRELVALLGNAVAGMHGMIDEHFGISVVEYMAAGAIPIVDVSSVKEARMEICFCALEDLKADFLQAMVLRMLEKLQNVDKLAFGENFLTVLTLAELRRVPIPNLKVKDLTLETMISQYAIPEE